MWTMWHDETGINKNTNDSNESYNKIILIVTVRILLPALSMATMIGRNNDDSCDNGTDANFADTWVRGLRVGWDVESN